MGGGGEGRDLLERPTVGRIVVAATVVVTAAGFVLSSRQDDPAELPGVALDSPFLLDLERALVVGAIFAAAAIFLVRGWGGYFPSKLSTTGTEYAKRSTVEEVARSGVEFASAVEDLEGQQVALARGARDDFIKLRDGLNELDRRLSRLDR